MGLFKGDFGAIRGEAWVNALQGTLACCNACASAMCTTCTPRGWVAAASFTRFAPGGDEGTPWFTITGTHTFTTSGTRTLMSQHQLHHVDESTPTAPLCL
jgi:hypothetical protein